MPRRARSIVGGYAYHVLNRANGRLPLFRNDADFAAFERVMEEAHERVPLRIIGYTLMGNHWHFVVWPRQRQDEEVSEFFRWLTVTHAQRWHAHHGTSGTGHVYQGRFKSFPIAGDEHLLAVLRYIERNPLRAGLVTRAEQWRWGSLYRRMYGTAQQRALLCGELKGTGVIFGNGFGPNAMPTTENDSRPFYAAWCEYVNEPQSEAELNAIRRSVVRGQPFGADAWRRNVARQLGLEHTFRSRGRPQ